MNKKCPITNDEIIDDCHIRIEFGYGSDLDLTTFEFSPVSDRVGKAVLKTIQDLMPENISIQKFSRDELHQEFSN